MPKMVATSLKSAKFLDFFWRNLKPNKANKPGSEGGRLHPEYPWLSPCGKEMNFVKAADVPIVFHTLTHDGKLIYAATRNVRNCCSLFYCSLLSWCILAVSLPVNVCVCVRVPVLDYSLILAHPHPSPTFITTPWAAQVEFDPACIVMSTEGRLYHSLLVPRISREPILGLLHSHVAQELVAHMVDDGHGGFLMRWKSQEHPVKLTERGDSPLLLAAAAAEQDHDEPIK